MTTDLRVLRAEDWDKWFGRLERAFGGHRMPDDERVLDERMTPVDRSLAVWDGDEVVGGAGAFAFRMAVPGGAFVRTAGVTMVAVAATHRRRGILTQLMRRQLDDVRAWGDPLAVLTASEPAIYGRYGYGTASRRLNLSIDTARVTLAAPAGTDAVRVRYADPVEALERCEEVYRRTVGSRPGMFERTPDWELRPLLDAESDRGGASPLQCVVAERDGAVAGYARFAVRPDAADRFGNGAGTVVVRGVTALDPATYAALWRFLCSIDLTDTVDAPNRPVDDPLLSLVSDVRRCRPALRDGLHLRPVEVGAALAARTYLTPVDVVLDVTDEFCPWNSGRWRLSGDAKGASCARTTDAAELALSVRELGAAYLGDVSLIELAGAGRVRELREGALAAASVAFGSAVVPWLPHGF